MAKKKAIQNEATSQDESMAFSDAFDEAVLEDVNTSPEEEEAVREEKTSSVEEGKPNPEEPTEEASEEKVESQQVEEKTSSKPAPVKSENWEQKYKSYKGHADAELKRFQEREKEYLTTIEDLKKQLESLMQSKPQEQPQEIEQPKEEPPEESIFDEQTLKEIEEWKRDYPEIAAPVEKLINSAVAKSLKLVAEVLTQRDKIFSSVLEPIINSYAESVQESHFRKIREAHPDFDEIRDSGKLKEWLNTLPAYLKLPLEKVYAEGTTDEVIDLINRFKEATAKAQPQRQFPKRELSDETKKVLSSLEAVKSKGGVSVPKGVGFSGSEDFDEAFNEAVRGMR